MEHISSVDITNQITVVQTCKTKLTEIEEAKKFIEDLNKSRTKKVIIPVVEGLAYFAAEINHTNECSIRLGEDYIIDTTNYKALRYLERETNRINEQLTLYINKQKESDQNSLKVANDQPVSVPQIPAKSVSIVNGAKLLKLSDDTIEIQEQPSIESTPMKKEKSTFSSELLKLKQKMQNKSNETADGKNNKQTQVLNSPNTISTYSDSTIDKAKPLVASKKKKDVISLKDEKNLNQVELTNSSISQANAVRSSFFDEEE